MGWGNNHRGAMRYWGYTLICTRPTRNAPGGMRERDWYMRSIEAHMRGVWIHFLCAYGPGMHCIVRLVYWHNLQENIMIKHREISYIQRYQLDFAVRPINVIFKRYQLKGESDTPDFVPEYTYNGGAEKSIWCAKVHTRSWGMRTDLICRYTCLLI